MKLIKKYKLEIMLSIIGVGLTLIARDYAVTQRSAIGLEPGWGGEFFIIPLMIIWYSIIKAEWSIEQ